MLRECGLYFSSRARLPHFASTSPISLILIILGSFMIHVAQAARVTLEWDENIDPRIAGYRIYYGTSSGVYDCAIRAGKVTSYTLGNLSEGQAYYFAATAYDIDNNESDFSEEVAYTITSQTTTPVADAGPDQEVLEASVVLLDAGNSFDPDGGLISHVWKQIGGPSVVLSDPDGIQTYFVTPAVGANGDTLSFALTVANASGVEAVDTCTVHILAANRAPLAEAGEDQTVVEGSTVRLNGEGSYDPENMPLSYDWVQTNGPGVPLQDADFDQPTFVAPDVAPQGALLTFQLTVRDVGGLQATDICLVRVSWDNASSSGDATPGQNVNVPSGGRSAPIWLPQMLLLLLR